MDGGIVVVIAVVALVALVLTVLGFERYRPRVQPERPVPTTEVFLDPVTHRRMRVWIDPASGAREYREELETTATALPPLERPGMLLPPDATPPHALPPPPPPPEA